MEEEGRQYYSIDSIEENLVNTGVTSTSTQRIILNLVLFTCNTCIYFLRVVPSTAVVYMYTSDTDRSLILSSFYWGYTLGQIPSALLITRFGAKRVLGVAAFWWSFGSFLCVLAYDLKRGIYPVIATRVIVGLAQGANFPCQGALITAWIPSNEMSRTAAITASGENIGTILAMWGGPLLIRDYGFRTVFWVCGTIGLAWLIPFLFLTSDRPASCDRGFDKVKIKTPWCSILSTFTFWVNAFAQFCFMWAWFVGLSWLPDYFDDEFSLNLDNLGFYTLLPYLAVFILSNIAGWIADALLARCRKSSVRKLMNTVGCLSSALFFYLMGTVTKDYDPSCSGHFCVRAVLLLTVAIATSGIAFSGWYASLMELSPRHSSAIVSLSFTFGTLPGVVGNLVTGLIISTSNGKIKDWSKVFLLCAMLLVLGAVIFLLFSEKNPPIALDKDEKQETRQSETSTVIESSGSVSKDNA